ncbi:DUF3558 family protein [Nocardia carnea]|uniref:DUF3558 family protein n=1 Tax=Nocardia carnea TaxID=37328 RepID=UPI0024547F08|nr:DUF3558 family protein [Nocardia carnea]
MTNCARILRSTMALTAGVSVALIAACETTRPAPATTVVVPVAPPVPERPWTVDELTYHPCSVLDADDTARFILEPGGEPATPPNALPACSWQSVQTSPAGRFSVRFTPSKSGVEGSRRQENQDSADREVTIGGNRAAVRPDDRYPDGSHGSCSVEVAVPSGGSFGIRLDGGGLHTGVAWDPCPQAVDIAGVIAGKLH